MLQGKSDPLVPKEEADQVADMLMKRANIVDVHHHPEEGHGFSERENQINAIRRTILWFEKYLPAHATAGQGEVREATDALMRPVASQDFLCLLQSCSRELKVCRGAMIRRDGRRNF